MTIPHAPEPQLQAALVPRPAGASLLRKVLRNPLALIPILFLTVVTLAAVFAPVLSPHDPNAASISDVLAPPGGTHLLGADGAGRDVLARLLYAGRFSLAGSVLALAIALVLGVVNGLIAGYFGKWFDTLATGVVAVLMALPGIIVLLAARAVVGPSMWIAMAIFGVMLSPAFFRLVYALVTGVRNELYVDAARVAGLSDLRIIGRHILTVVRAPLVIQAAIVGGVALAIQSGLEFLGLGDANVPTWGAMLNDGFVNIYRAPALILWPAAMIGLTLISLTLLANSLRDELERSSAPQRRRRAKRSAVPATQVDPSVVIRHDADREPSGMLLDIAHLTVGYDQPDGSVKRVVEDVSLTVARGEVHALVGESGSGKTQTAWSVLGLLPPGGRIVGGAIVFDGTDLTQLGRKELQRFRGKRIAYIPQEPMSNLDPSFTVGSQMVEPMMVNLGISRGEAKRRALDLLGRVGIPNPQRTFDAYPHQVSGGMAQRVLIAGAISCEPDLLIADEPTTALDVTVQAEVLDVLRDLQSDMHMGVILVTHNFGVVADLSDRVSVMQTGRIVESGPTRSIFANPRHPYTRELLGAILHDTEPRGPLTATPEPAASNLPGGVR